jgi:hypothetical protein
LLFNAALSGVRNHNAALSGVRNHYSALRSGLCQLEAIAGPASGLILAIASSQGFNHTGQGVKALSTP